MIWKKESKILINQSLYYPNAILSYCLKCKKNGNTESKNPKLVSTKNGRKMLLWKCAACDSKKTKFIKEEEAMGLISSLGIKAPLNKITLFGPVLF